MRDPRALANTRNLQSWRAWEREAHSRSGLGPAVLLIALSSPLFGFVASWTERATRGDARAFASLMAVALALYLAACGGVMLAGVLRMNAWMRDHPWTPPSPRTR